MARPYPQTLSGSTNPRYLPSPGVCCILSAVPKSLIDLGSTCDLVDSDHCASWEGSVHVWKQFAVGSWFPTHGVAEKLGVDSENDEVWIAREEALGGAPYLC